MKQENKILHIRNKIKTDDIYTHAYTIWYR